MIEEIPIKLVDKIKFNPTVYPQCSCNNCPRFYWNALFVGARASGKTYSCCQLVKHYENNKIYDKDGNITPIRTHLISPTILQNEIFNTLKSLDENDKHDNYTDKVLLDIIDDIRQVKEEAEDFKNYVNIYKKFIKIKSVRELNKSLSLEELLLLERHQYQHYDDIEQPRFKVPPLNICIMDDLIGSDCFNKKSKSVFSNALIKSRHLNIAFCILVQNLKSTPKVVRLNCNLFWLGSFANFKTILIDFYPEISSIATEDQFHELYSHAIKDKYGALVVDFTAPKENAFKKGWISILKLISSNNNIENADKR